MVLTRNGGRVRSKNLSLTKPNSQTEVTLIVLEVGTRGPGREIDTEGRGLPIPASSKHQGLDLTKVKTRGQVVVRQR